jgi:TetR/AcrR family transcriptional regulator, transcriptional repressor for nem operon
MSSRPPSTSSHRGPGRPREFDLDTVVDGAVGVFRERGYHATSVGDLSAATGLTAGSLYKAFGDKRGIFLAALDRYITVRNTELRRLLDAQSNGRDKIRTVLRFYAEASHGSEGRRGCLVASSAMALATLDEDLAAKVEAAMRRTEDMLHQLLRQGQEDGSIAPELRVPTMASNLLALLYGFRSIGKLGRTRPEMLAAADEALRLLD